MWAPVGLLRAKTLTDSGIALPHSLACFFCSGWCTLPSPRRQQGEGRSRQWCLHCGHMEGYVIILAPPADNEVDSRWLGTAMIKLPKTKARAVGVSNFTIEHVCDYQSVNYQYSNFWLLPPQLEAIINATGVAPAANQIERHPLLQQPELISYCQQKNIHITAYSVC